MRPRPICIASIKGYFLLYVKRVLILLNFCTLPLHAQQNAISGADQESVAKKDKPQYTLNVLVSGGAGFLGLGAGAITGIVVSMPFCFGSTSKVSCLIPSTSAVYIGSSLGMGIAIDWTARKFGLKHRTFWSIIGGFVGSSGFAYLWYKTLEEGDHPGSPIENYGVLGIASAIIANLIFVYADSLQHDETDIRVTLNMRHDFSESVFQPMVVKRF